MAVSKLAPAGMRQKGKKKNFINAKFSANTRNGSKVVCASRHKGTTFRVASFQVEQTCSRRDQKLQPSVRRPLFRRSLN
jgi:hypothetical protein